MLVAQGVQSALVNPPVVVLGSGTVCSNAQVYCTAQVTAEPYITCTDLQIDDDFLILACDGIWDVFEDTEAKELVSASLASGKNCAQACERLRDAALEKGSRVRQANSKVLA